MNDLRSKHWAYGIWKLMKQLFLNQWIGRRSWIQPTIVSHPASTRLKTWNISNAIEPLEDFTKCELIDEIFIHQIVVYY